MTRRQGARSVARRLGLASAARRSDWSRSAWSVWPNTRCFKDFLCLQKRRAPALVISVALSDPPIVALGAGVFSGGKLMLGLALLGVFALAVVAGAVKKYQRRHSKQP